MILTGMIAACLLTILPSSSFAAEISLIPAGANWSYLDDGTEPAAAWRDLGFDDSAWAGGPAELGYGDGDEATVVSFGTDPNNKHITTYFRHEFTVADASIFLSLSGGIVRDDGAVVYLNGTEVFRTNMPSGTITSTTPASSAAIFNDESDFFSFPVDPALLQTGSNVVAVGVHQVGPASSDVSFDLRLTGQDELVVTRGPYLQQATPDGITIRWRTNAAAESRVAFGDSPSSLTTTILVSTMVTEHVVPVSGLEPDTRYYYSVGTQGEVLAGGDADHSFLTSPMPGRSKPSRIWVVGDSGTADSHARDVRDAFLGWTGQRGADLWLMLGDNAYDDGTDEEYQAAVFETYPSILHNTTLWPAFGNHDARSASNGSGVYFDIFTIPTNGESGGVASGTEHFYSFDYGDIHFICLDSQQSFVAANSVMITWLENDLVATDQKWVIAFWHHPPYSKGSHDSDSEGRLIKMREFAVPVLEDHGVDLVLTGHSHSYERSYLLDGHYGDSTTLAPEHILDGGDGKPDGDGAYEKPTLGMAPHEGAVYVVAGNAGKITGGSLDHPAMYFSLNDYGSVAIDVEGDRMDVTLIDDTGAIPDYFTIEKGPAPEPVSFQRLDSSPTNQELVQFEAAFSEPVTGFDASDLLVMSRGGLSSPSITTIAGGPTSYTITLDTGEGSGQIEVVLQDDDSIRDVHGNALGGSGVDDFSGFAVEFIVDKKEPEMAPGSELAFVGGTNFIGNIDLAFQVGFTEAVSGMTPSAVSLAASMVDTGNLTVLVMTTKGALPVYEIQVQGAVPSAEELTVKLVSGVIQDLAGNAFNPAGASASAALSSSAGVDEWFILGNQQN